MPRSVLIILLAFLCLAPRLYAQQDKDTALSEKEIEQLRDSAYFPADRVIVFIKFLDQRSKAIQDLFAHPRKPGREQDTHDLMEEFTSVADELDDNLDDYGTRHRDIRKSLPKLVEATDRWATALKTPPDNSAYSVSRKLALESIRDIREAATQLIEDQRTWFAAHPPAKTNPNTPYDIPRS
jgi:hypothetical protein